MFFSSPSTEKFEGSAVTAKISEIPLVVTCEKQKLYLCAIQYHVSQSHHTVAVRSNLDGRCV
jgi:hypothetical protein